MRVQKTLLFLLPTLASAQDVPTTITQSNLPYSIPETLLAAPSPASPTWIPIRTITEPVSEASPSPSSFQAVPQSIHMELREVVNAAPAALPATHVQVSPVTTLYEQQMVNGVAQQVQVVYSQAFSAVPDQGPAPQAGVIGLGTITGRIGVTKTVAARSLETNLKERRANGSGQFASVSSVVALMTVAATVAMLA